MKLIRSLQVALLGAVLLTPVLAQTEADVASLLPKAQRGNAIAQYNLGLAYRNGKGVAADPIEAYVWLSLAHEGGFRGKALSVVASGLDPADFEIARKRLAERRASLNLKSAAAASPKTEANDAEAAIPVVRTEASTKPMNASPATAQNPNPAQELTAAIADKQQLSTELSKSWGETEELKKQLAETQTAAEFLTAETSKLHGERDALTTKLTALTNEVASLRTDRDNARSLGVQAEATANQATAQKAALESSLQEAQTGAATDKKWLSDELTKAFQEITSLKAQLATAAKNEAAAAAAPAHPDLSGKMKELETSLAAASAEATAAKQEATRLADERIDREKQLIALQQQSTELATARDSLRKEVQNLRQAPSTPVAPAYPDLREQAATLETQVAALKTDASRAREQIATLTLAKLAAEKSLTQIPAAPAYPDLSGKVTELEGSLSAISAKANSAQQEATRLADERIEREKQLIAVQQQATELTTARDSLQQEVQNLRRAAATPVASSFPDQREKVTALETQVADLKADASEARQQISALTQAKEAAEKSFARKSATPAYPDLSGKVKELEASLSAASAKVNSAQQEAARLAEERIDREKQLIALQQQSTELTAARASLQQEVQGLRQAATAPAAPTAPAYPDLRQQVAALETQLAAVQAKAAEKPPAPSPAAPAYPDLSDKVKELEASLAARSTDSGQSTKAVDELRQAKANAEQKLTAAEQSRNEVTQQFEEFKRSALVNQREHLNRQAQVQMLESEKAALRQQSNADQTRLADLSAQLAASRRKADEVYPTAPAYPDQRARVEQLEAELTKTNEQANSMIAVLNHSQQEAKAAAEQAEQLRSTIRDLEKKAAATAPVYPDLREQVSNLEIQLDAARALPKTAVSATEFNNLKQELSDTRQKLATTLNGYALMEKERDELASRPAPAAAPDQSHRVRELEAQLAAKSAPAAPAYPDLRNQVATLEAALTAAKSTGPAYPDLREQVSNLEIQLDAARALPKTAISPADFNALQQELAETKDKLATTLRGYSLIEKERDELAAKPDRAGGTQSDVARLTEAYTALQRANAQTERELVIARAQLQQAPNISAPIAQQAPQPRTTPVPVTPRVVPTASTTPIPAVVAGPAPSAVRRTHIVVAGDNLVKISQRYYGNATSWQPIYNANRELLGPNGTLKVGTELRIP